MREKEEYLNSSFEAELESYRPRMIVWQLSAKGTSQTFSTHECLLTIDSIARTAKPIVVLTGDNVLGRDDLYQIVEYGAALGLKMIVEARPQELSDAVLERYSSFGPKLFRVLLDDCIQEDAGTRFRRSSSFLGLEEVIDRVKKGNYEIHLGVTVTNTYLREFAFHHDYAFRHGVNGLYCHLCFEDSDGNSDRGLLLKVDEFIEAIARMKSLTPKQMYVSPQCVKYGLHHASTKEAFDSGSREHPVEWTHWCLAGKSFAFINPSGKVQLCSSLSAECGDLRTNGYDFKEIWASSELFHRLRSSEESCEEVRSYTKTGEIVEMTRNGK